MVNWRINRIKEYFLRQIEGIFFSNRTKGTSKDIILLKLDRLGDYILFRNFIEEIHKLYKNSGRLILCGNIMWKEFAEKLDGQFISEFIWIDVPLLENYAYRFSIYRKIRRMCCDRVVYCAYSRTLQGDNLAIHSGCREIIGYDGDDVNISAEKKRDNDAKYDLLVHSKDKCLFEFYRNRILFEHVLGKKIDMDKPWIKIHPILGEERNKYIVLFPGAGQKERRWSTSNFSVLCHTLYQLYQLPIIICGAENENILGEEIIALTGSFVTNHVGKYSLYETLEVLEKAYLVVSNDSGPLHMAIAMRIPTLCISNGNYFKRFCPYPPIMNMPLALVLPDEFEEKLKDGESASLILCQGSDVDINCIKPDKVILTLKNSNILRHA